MQALFVIRQALRALVFLICVIGATLPGLAQGGQGGFGGGGFGGGRLVEPRATDGDVVKAVNILTAGDRVEYPLTVKAGETILAEVETTNFDSALEVVTAAGKVLAQNDDRRSGEQDARLLYTFPEAGSYKLLVRSFKGAAGGQFELRLRRFVPTVLELGATVPLKENLSYFRVRADDQQLLLFSVKEDRNAELMVFSPDGEPLTPQARNGGRGRSQLRAGAKGTYFLRVEATATVGTIHVEAARVLTHTLGQDSTPQTLSADGLDIWRFQGTAGQLVRLRARTETGTVQTQLDFRPAVGISAASTRILAASGLEHLSVPTKARGEEVAVLRQSGTFEVTVTHSSARDVHYTLTSTTEVKRWDTATLTEQLPLGKAEFYQLTGRAGEILSLLGHTDQFDMALQLYDAQGAPIAFSDDEGSSTDPLIRKLLTATQTYFLRVHAFGDGGSGRYSLERTTTPLRGLEIGTRTEATLAPGGTAIWSFTGKKGEERLLDVRARDGVIAVRLFGPNGAELSVGSQGTTGRTLAGLSLPQEGTYTVWVSSSTETAGARYTIRLLVDE